MRKGPLIPALLVVVLVVACGGDDVTGAETTTATQMTTTTVATTTTTTTTAPATEAFPVTVTLANGEVTLEERPSRIVSLSPTATEMLFAIGAGDQVVATDEYSTYPEEAPVTDLSGFTPNVEAVLAFDPDLVVVSNDIEDVVGSLQRVGVPVALLPAAAELEDVYEQLEIVGLLTGHVEEAEELVADMRAEIEAVLQHAPTFDEPLTYYHELDPTFYTITSDTFVGRVYGLFGLASIADPADEAGFGYPQLAAEYVIGADPDLIFLADAQCCGVTPSSLAERPGWGELTAVATGRVFEVDADLASRWGPRIVDYVTDVADALATVED